MRVLIVTPPTPREGRPSTTAFIARQIESLRMLGIAIDVIEADGPSRTKYVRAAHRVRQRSQRYDLVHAHYGFCGWVARAQLARPVVVSFLGSDLLYWRARNRRMVVLRQAETRSNRLLARLVDAVIVKSEEMAEAVRSVRPHVVPNGVDLETFTPRRIEDARHDLGWPQERRRVLFPGNPDQIRKGFPLARAAIDEASRLLGEQLDIVALRGIPPARVPTLMNACDAMVLTSLAEGSPNVVKEAMACNLPVVSVAVGDVEYLLEGVHRCRIASREATALAEALVDVLSERGETGGRRALEEKGLDADTVARRIVTIYEDVLTRDQTRRESRPR